MKFKIKSFTEYTNCLEGLIKVSKDPLNMVIKASAKARKKEGFEYRIVPPENLEGLGYYSIEEIIIDYLEKLQLVHKYIEKHKNEFIQSKERIKKSMFIIHRLYNKESTIGKLGGSIRNLVNDSNNWLEKRESLYLLIKNLEKDVEAL